MTDTPITYVEDFISNPSEVFAELKALDWERRDTTPRSEYYVNDFGAPYTYGTGRGRREYLPRVKTPQIDRMQNMLAMMTGHNLEVCFLNRYLDQSDQLGWHADNSPEMDDARPIAIISLGVEREIWFRENDPQANMLRIVSEKPIHKLLLGNGSLCLMAPGMQDTHQHRIPKASRQVGERISLTYRGYVK